MGGDRRDGLTALAGRPPGPSEGLRQAVHILAGLGALGLRWVGPVLAAVGALGLVLFNAFLLHRVGGARLWRAGELDGRWGSGIVLYPASVLATVLLFPARLEIAAAAWGLLAFGDGFATVLGRAGSRRLPWNPDKTWLGSLSFLVFGGLAVGGLLLWTAPGRYRPGFALTVGALAGLLGAALESAPARSNDNPRVTLVVAAVLAGLLPTAGRWGVVTEPALLERLALGGAVNLGLCGLAVAARSLAVGGAVAAFVVGALVFAAGGWPGYLLLVAFFVVGSGCTRLGYRRKAAAGLAESRGGRRGAGAVIANGGVPVLAAVLALVAAQPAPWVLAFAGALAAAAADTAASEIGQLRGRGTVLITTLRPVAPGTDGGISLAGTGAGLAAALAIALCGLALGLYELGGAVAVAAAGLVATLLESVVGATLERRGALGNDEVNFLNSAFGAILAAAGAGLTA